METPAEFRAWAVDPHKFPGHHQHPGLKLRFLVQYAVLAPSGHNTQPWLFHVENEALELWADRMRSLPVVDPHDRELTISCGCALMNLRLSAKHFGYRTRIELLAERATPDLLARLTLVDRVEASLEERMLFEAIPRRRTNRGRFKAEPIDDKQVQVLTKAAHDEGAWLHVVKDKLTKHQLAELIAEAEKQQFHDVRFRRELASWVHPNRSHSKEGMPGYSHGASDLKSMIEAWVIRHFDVGASAARHDHELAERAPLLAAIGTRGDGAEQWLRTGMALQRLLLHATSAGLAVSYFNAPIELEGMRPHVAKLLGEPGHPQLLVRIGVPEDATPPKPTPRRPAEECVRI